VASLILGARRHGLIRGIYTTGLLTLLSRRSKIGAFVGLNGWLPLQSRVELCRDQQDLATFFEAILHPKDPEPQREEWSMLRTPIFLAHNTDDEVIDIRLGREARDVLRGLGMIVTWKEEEHGGHLGMLESKGLDSVVAFLKGVGDFPA